jgi:hypothetical protein
MERKIYKEIPGGKNNFHSAVLTTFSFNFHHFEGQVLRILKEKWVTSVNVLVDQNMLNFSLGVSSNYLKSINQAYAVNGIKSSGAFHPKINFFIGDSSLLAIFGSGNITPGGHGKNHEVFSGFYADSADKTELPLLLELWEYLIRFTKQMDGYSAERICKTITGCCDLFSNEKLVKHQFYNIDKNLDAALLYNEKGTSIYHQLSNLIPINDIEDITIVCPYYDEDGALLKDFCQLFPNANLNIYLQENDGLPPTRIEADERIVFYDFNEATRGKITNNALGDGRMLHAKIFHFKSTEKEYCLVGSANATIAAMGSSNFSYQNDELCVLYASLSFDFLNTLGINKVSKPIKNIAAFSRQGYYGENAPALNSRTKHIIKSIDLERRQLKIYVNSRHIFTESCYLTAFGRDGVECFSFQINDGQQEIFEFTLSIEQSDPDWLPQYCAFVDTNGAIISNKQPVNRIDKLRNTNPEKNLRNIREIIGKIEVGQFNELEIADYLTQLYREDTGAKRASSHGGLRENKEAIAEKNISTLSYDEAIAASNDTSVLSRIASGHITSRLWQSLEYILENKSNAILDELMDEEEEASATEGKDRKVGSIEECDSCVKIGNDITRPFNIVKKLTEKYCSNLKRAQFNEEHVIGIIDYLRFLLSSYTITAICHFNEYTSFPKETNIADWKKKLHYLYLESIQSILVQFTLLHQCRKIAKYAKEQDDLTFRHNDLLNKTLYHILLDVALAYNSLGRQEPVVKEQIILCCLNIFDKCGLPNDGLKDYLEKLSAANSNSFYPPHVLEMLDEIVDASRYGTYKKAEKLGICKIDTVQGGKYRIKTIYSNSYSFTDKKNISDFTL